MHELLCGKYCFYLSSKWLLLIIIIFLSVSVFTVIATSSTNAVLSIADVSALKSASGHYVVVSTNSVWNTSLMRWIESVEVKVERIAGIKIPFDSRVIRIVIIDKPSGTSDVVWSQGQYKGKLVQQLTIYDYLHADIARSEVAICGLFLNGYVVEILKQNKAVTDWSNMPTKVGKVPSWLALGVARNLYSAYRAANSVELLTIYDKGELPSVNDLLEQFGNLQLEDTLDKYVCGMFVLWLSKLPGYADIFDKIFSIVADGKTLTATSLSSIIKSCDSVEALEKMWIDWVVRQKRMIYDPGIITSDMVEKLRTMLVVTPEECRVAKGPATDISFQFSELISLRREFWVSAYARQKIIRLKLTFVGRGKDMNKVVDLYCEFLSALEKHKSKKRLTKLLKSADGAMALLIEKYGGKEMVK